MRVAFMLFVCLFANEFAVGQCPTILSNGADPECLNFLGGWGKGARVQVWVNPSDFSADAIAKIRSAFSNWQTGFSISGVTFAVFVGVGPSPGLDISIYRKDLSRLRKKMLTEFVRNANYEITDAEIEVDPTMPDVGMEPMMAHEIGHTFWLCHCHDGSVPCAGNSVMAAEVTSSSPTAPQDCDKAAVLNNSGGRYYSGGGGGDGGGGGGGDTCWDNCIRDYSLPGFDGIADWCIHFDTGGCPYGDYYYQGCCYAGEFETGIPSISLLTTVNPHNSLQRRAVLSGIATSPRASLGPKDAPVTITMFSDFQCPYCAKLAKTLQDELPRIEDGKVRVVFVNLPLPSHPWARAAAEAAACAQASGGDAFWRLHDYLFEHQNELTSSNLREAVLAWSLGSPGLDASSFKACIEQGLGKQAVNDDIAIALQLGVRSTPTLFINEWRFGGAIPGTLIRAAIQSILDGNSTAMVRPVPHIAIGKLPASFGSAGASCGLRE